MVNCSVIGCKSRTELMEENISFHTNSAKKRSHESWLRVGSRDNCKARRRSSNDMDYEPSSPPPRRYRAGFVTRSSAQPLQCKSPSTDSTTSLARLPEKLTALSPFAFNKVPAKIAVTPELCAIKEQEEYDRLSHSEPRLRCGVALSKLYHSDSEARTVLKKPRLLQPVVKKALNAALGSSDQSVIKATFEQLCRKTTQVDLGDLLVKEAIKHGQDKDSGIISGKVTQDSDIVEDTPFEEPAHRIKSCLKGKPKHFEDNKDSTDDSDVVDDTPHCDYDWRKKVQTKSDKTNKNKNYDSEALNDEAVDHYFCQQTHADLIDLISPTTVQEDSENDCVEIDDIQIYEEENNEVHLTTEADIVDCVNYLVDTVCYNLDNCVNLHKEQEQEIDILRVTKANDNRSTDITRKISKMNKNTPNTKKSTEHTLDEQNTDVPTRVTQKQETKMNATPQKRSKPNIHPNVVEKDSVLQERTNLKSPSNNSKRLIRKKRKLYSPKEFDNENHDSPRSRKEPRASSSTESPIAACYKDLENARKSRIRLPRNRASMQPVISPKTKKLDDMFNKIKDIVANDEIITLVDKKSTKDLHLYNMSSESDDEAFKKKKIQVQKRVSSSSLESTSKKRRSVKPVNYTQYYSSEDECPLSSLVSTSKKRRSVKPLNYTSSEDESQRVQKPKTVKQTKLKYRSVKKIARPNLADEKMRTKQSEVLETSFVQEKCDMHVPEVPEPALQMPVLEAISDDDLIDKPIISKNKLVTPKKSEIIKIKTEKSLKKKYDKLTKPTITNKSKKIATNVAIESATVSPLPGLVVETEPRKDDLTSSLDAKLLQKLKNIYTEVVDLSTTRDTQDMVLNNNGRENEMLDETGNRQNLSNYQSNNDNDPSTAQVQIIDLPDDLSEKSIPTCGSSPITAHIDPDESPPNFDTVYERFRYRDVDIEGRSSSIAKFLDDMRNEAIKSKPAAIKHSPVIPITRMSTNDSSQSNVTVRRHNVESNTKPMNTPSHKDSTKPMNTPSHKDSNKTDPKERLPSKTSRISTKDSARSVLSVEKLPEKSHLKPNLSSNASSDKTNPRVLLDRMSSRDIESPRNPVTPSKNKASRNLTLPSAKYGKIVTPNRSNSTVTSVPALVLDRISSDEINRWLPMPETEVVEVVDEPRSPVIMRKRQRSLSRPCSVCEQSKISPVKLNFDNVDTTTVRISRSRTRSVNSKSRPNINKLRTKNASRKDTAVDKDINSQETAVKSSEEMANRSNQEDLSETNRNVASVQSWVERNAEVNSTNTDDLAATKRILLQEIMETLDTRLVEINERSGEAMQQYMLKDAEELKRIKVKLERMGQENYRVGQEIDSLKAIVVALMQSRMDGACALIRNDAENKAMMLRLLKADIIRNLK